MQPSNLQPLGKIVRLQIQRASLKLGQKPNRYYDPAALLPVEALTLTPPGAVAFLPDGSAVMDVHHAAHPLTRTMDGVNDLSVGFTGHYARLRARYGLHLADGCAGENILVENPDQIELSTLQHGLAIQSAVSGAWVRLQQVAVALPCVEFSAYAARQPGPAATKAALQFLDHGLRGFYCVFEDPGSASVALGDTVYALRDINANHPGL